jgi:uncharacterized protein YndB with AHSA1/START domain
MTEPTAVLSISRDIDAPAEQVFALLATPARHPDIDGSGLVQSADAGQVITAVGDTFDMRMSNDYLGDYVIENRVVEFEPDRRIAWEPVLKETDRPEAQSNVGVSAHLRWVWEVVARPDGGIRVTESYDLSRCPDWLREATRDGEDWREAIEASLENLARLVE